MHFSNLGVKELRESPTAGYASPSHDTELQSSCYRSISRLNKSSPPPRERLMAVACSTNRGGQLRSRMRNRRSERTTSWFGGAGNPENGPKRWHIQTPGTGENASTAKTFQSLKRLKRPARWRRLDGSARRAKRLPVWDNGSNGEDSLVVPTVEKRLKRSNVQNGENGSNTENGLEVKRDQEQAKAQKAKHSFQLDFVTIQKHSCLFPHH